VYRYKLHYEDGSEAGEAMYAVLIAPGEEILTGDGRKLRVLGLVYTDEDSDKYEALLMVKAA
jgi:hypothetical protein